MRIFLLVGAVAVSAGAGCTDTRVSDALLEPGARVRFQTTEGRSRWDDGLVGTVGGCTAVLVPASWDTVVGFSVVRIDSVTALRMSTRYDGRLIDGERRRATFPPDTAGEEWRELSVSEIRARFGSCEPGV